MRKILRSGATAFKYERSVQPQRKIGPWREELDRLLAVNATRASRERLTLIRIFGIDVDEACRVIDAQGRATPRLLAIGPVSRGALWEITAIPDIRPQVARVAARLVRA